jgi:hypothetical protein
MTPNAFTMTGFVTTLSFPLPGRKPCAFWLKLDEETLHLQAEAVTREFS